MGRRRQERDASARKKRNGEGGDARERAGGGGGRGGCGDGIEAPAVTIRYGTAAAAMVVATANEAALLATREI